jgi:glycosyltransferase involved in cell wall biosynthesis
MMLSNQKILLVIDRLTNPHAGTEGQFILLIDLLVAAGLEVQAIVLANSTWLDANRLACPVTVVGSTSIKQPGTWFRLYQLARSFKKNGFTLAHVFFNDSSVMCPPMFKLAGIKTIISRRDMGFWYNSIYRFLLPITGRCVDLVISNSEAVSAITGEVEKIPAAKRVVIYNGYNRSPEQFSVVTELQSLRESGAVIFGLVANIRPIKRMQDAIAALASVKDSFQQAHLVIIGAGDAGPLQLLATNLGVAGRVHCLGSRGDIPDCLQYFSAGLLCSESEGFSNAIVEYQFAGLPVICTRTGGNPEAVVQGETGWLYEVGDVAVLAEAFAALLSSPELAVAMGKRAREIATERYTVDKMFENHIRVYNSLVRNQV